MAAATEASKITSAPRAGSRPAAAPSAPTEERTWTVRELADEFEITTRTLRFYEAEGLIAPVRVGTTRIYHSRDRTRLRLILRGRRIGMTLAECAAVIDIYDGAATSEQRQLRALLERLEVIRADLGARQADLERSLSEVDEVTDQCRRRLKELNR